MRFSRRATLLISAPAVLTLIVFFVLPLLYFLRFSFNLHTLSQMSIAAWSFHNFITFFHDPFYVGILERTVIIAVISTIVTLMFAFPTAYLLTKTRGALKSILIIVTVFPLLVGDVVRAIGWVALLGYTGPVNDILVSLHLLPNPLDLARTAWAVTVAIISVVLPIMILVLQASLEAVDPATERAAIDLGASPYATLWKVVLPQVGPAIIAGTSLVFVLCINSFATPLLVGASRVQMMAPEMYTIITNDNNWPLGAAMAFILLVVTVLVTALYGSFLRRQLEGWRTVS